MTLAATVPKRIGPRVSKIAAQVAAIFLAGCAAPEGAAGPASVVFERETRTDELSPEAAEIEEALDAVERASLNGDYEDVIRKADLLLANPCPAPIRSRVSALRTEARRKLLQTLYVDAIVRLDREDVPLGDPITGEVLLVNLSGKPVVLRDVARGAGGRSTLRVDVGYTEDWADGTFVRDRIVWAVAIGRDLTLPPGGREALPLDLDTLARRDGPGHPVRTYDVSATLFPAELLVDGEPVPGSLSFAQKRVRVFPRNYEHLKNDPLGRLKEAIDKRSPTHVVLAAALIAPKDREAGKERLLATLEGRDGAAPDAAVRASCCAAARVLTDGEPSLDAETWIERLRRDERR